MRYLIKEKFHITMDDGEDFVFEVDDVIHYDGEYLDRDDAKHHLPRLATAIRVGWMEPIQEGN
jgi:hypothetical protein